MSALLDQLRGLPTINLIAYLLGTLAVVTSMGYLNGVKPAYLQMVELHAEHQQLSRLASKFDETELQSSIEEIKEKQVSVKASMLKDIPDRDLDNELPSLLEALHRFAKLHGLRTRQLRPGEVSRNAEIARVPVSIVVVGAYPHIFRWIQEFTRTIEGISVADIRADQSPGNNGFRTMTMNLVIYGR